MSHKKWLPACLPAWSEVWTIETQRFSLPSSLGPELSRFWENRTSVSHPFPLPVSQSVASSLLLRSLLTGCLAAEILSDPAGLEALLFFPLLQPNYAESSLTPHADFKFASIFACSLLDSLQGPKRAHDLGVVTLLTVCFVSRSL